MFNASYPQILNVFRTLEDIFHSSSIKLLQVIFPVFLSIIRSTDNYTVHQYVLYILI